MSVREQKILTRGEEKKRKCTSGRFLRGMLSLSQRGAVVFMGKGTRGLDGSERRQGTGQS